MEPIMSVRAALVALVFPVSLFAQGLPRAAPESVGLSGPALARIKPWLQTQVDSGKYAGAIVAVARRGKLVWTGSAGWLDREKKTPMSSAALFQVCSMSKPITAAGVLTLIDAGKLRLDDPVSKYIPAFASTKVYASGGAAMPVLKDPEQPIRISNLLTHTSGLTYGLFSNTPVDTIYLGANLFSSHHTLAELADTLAKLPLLFSPGTDWHYGFSLDVLGRVIEVASGQSFDRYLTEHLFAPLGMTRTGFHPVAGSKLATMYDRKPDGSMAPAAAGLCFDPSPEAKLLAGGSGILSTPGDYLRFLQMLLNGGTLAGHRVLKPETVRLMLSNELPSGVPGGRLNPSLAQPGYGQGFGGAVLVDSAASGFPGSPGIYRWWGYASTYFWIDPKQQLIGMLWSQLEPGSPLTPLEFQRLVYAAVKH
jgi:CubicO group peptidase (beta-lactamase class C family)